MIFYCVPLKISVHLHPYQVSASIWMDKYGNMWHRLVSFEATLFYSSNIKTVMLVFAMAWVACLTLCMMPAENIKHYMSSFPDCWLAFIHCTSLPFTLRKTLLGKRYIRKHKYKDRHLPGYLEYKVESIRLKTLL